jgi:hypothetical protein
MSVKAFTSQIAESLQLERSEIPMKRIKSGTASAILPNSPCFRRTGHNITIKWQR